SSSRQVFPLERSPSSKQSSGVLTLTCTTALLDRQGRKESAGRGDATEGAAYRSPTRLRSNHSQAIKATNKPAKSGAFHSGRGGSDSIRTCRPRGNSASSLPASP